MAAGADEWLLPVAQPQAAGQTNVTGTELWRGIWESPSGALVLAGEGGALGVRPAGASALVRVTPLHPVTDAGLVLRDVWGTADDDILLVADDGLYGWKLDGGNRPAALYAAPLWKVHGTLGGRAFAVGDDGLIITRVATGAGWTVSHDGGNVLNSVTVTGPGEAFAAGELGRVLEWDGAVWADLPAAPDDLFDIAATPTRLYAVGSGGTAFTFRRGQALPWVDLRAPTDSNLERVRVHAGRVFVVGGHGAVLSLPEGP
jgi:hypothetical protein